MGPVHFLHKGNTGHKNLMEQKPTENTKFLSMVWSHLLARWNKCILNTSGS